MYKKYVIIIKNDGNSLFSRNRPNCTTVNTGNRQKERYIKVNRNGYKQIEINKNIEPKQKKYTEKT